MWCTVSTVRLLLFLLLLLLCVCVCVCVCVCAHICAGPQQLNKSVAGWHILAAHICTHNTFIHMYTVYITCLQQVCTHRAKAAEQVNCRHCMQDRTHTHTHSHTHTHWQVCKYTHNTTACKITRTHTRSLTHSLASMYVYTRQHMIYIIYTSTYDIYVHTTTYDIYHTHRAKAYQHMIYIYTIHIQTTYIYIYTRQHMYIYIYIHTTTYVCMIYIIHTGPKRLTKLLVSFVCERMMWYVIGWCDMW